MVSLLPSSTTLAPSPTPSFSFRPLTTAYTGGTTTIEWDYSGPLEHISFFVTPAVLLTASQSNQTDYDVQWAQIAFGIDVTLGTWTWQVVDIAAGAYLLGANGESILVSSPFVVANPSATTSAVKPPNANPSSTISPSPGRSSHFFIAAFVGGTIGAVAFLAVATYTAHWLLKRRRQLPVLPFSSAIHKQGGQPSREALQPKPAPASIILIGENAAEKVNAPTESTENAPSISLRTSSVSMIASRSTSLFLYSERHHPGALGFNPPPSRSISRTPSPSSLSRTRTRKPVPSMSVFSIGSQRYSVSDRNTMLGYNSPAPSSATSQMYRVRESAWSEWAAINMDPDSPREVWKGNAEKHN